MEIMPSRNPKTERPSISSSSGRAQPTIGSVTSISLPSHTRIWSSRGVVTEASCGSGSQSNRSSKMRLPIPNILKSTLLDIHMAGLSQPLLTNMFGSTVLISAVKRIRMESPVMDSDVRDVILVPFFRGRRCRRNSHRGGSGSTPFAT